MLWWNMICNRQPCVYTICLINKMNSIKSANVMSLCMIRRHYINGTICARHIMKLFMPSTFYNPLLASICVSCNSKNNIKQSNMRCAENVDGKK